jgi:hypothetical protein
MIGFAGGEIKTYWLTDSAILIQLSACYVRVLAFLVSDAIAPTSTIEPKLVS